MSDIMGEYVEKVEADGIVLPAQKDYELDVAARAKEGEIVDKVRANAHKAADEIDRQLERLAQMNLSPDQTVQTARALADVQSKSVDALIKLTGRDHKPPETDLAQTLRGLAAAGMLRAHVELGPPEGS